MITFSFKTILASAGNSKEGNRPVSPFSRWFYRFGTSSALAACLVTAAPPSAVWAIDSLPTPAHSRLSAEIDQLARSLKSDDPELRKTAAQDLTRMGDAAKPAIPQLLERLADENPIVRATAARAVWEIDQRAEAALPVLIELLESPQTSHRELAAYFLGPMGDAAKPASAALRRAMAGTSPALRVHAAEALAQIEPADAGAVEVLLEALKDPSADVRSLAALASGLIDPAHKDRVVPALAVALADADAGVRSAAELSLCSFNVEVAHSKQKAEKPARNEFALPAREAVVPTVENLTPFSNANLTPIPVSVPSNELEKAVQDLSNDSPAVRKNALERIGWMGADGAQALADVAVCLEDPHPEVRAYAAKTLWDIDPHSALAAVNTLREMVDSTQPGVRPLAAFYLGYMGQHAASALPTLKRALTSAESTEQLQIAEAVARISPEDSDAVNVLIGGLRDPESRIRFQAAYALSQVSPTHAERIVPELSTAMRDQSPEVRQAAELALAGFPQVPIRRPQVEPIPSAPIITPKADVSPSAPVLVAQEQPAPELPAEFPQVALLDPEPVAPAPIAQVQLAEFPQVALLDPEPVAPAPIAPTQEPAAGAIVPEMPGAGNIAPSKSSDLGLGNDYKPISAVGVSIGPKRRDEDGRLLALPTNYGAAWLQEVGTHYSPIGDSRPWTLQSVEYAASGFCHRPLYFEEINLERYGHNFGHCVQPFVSGVAFFGRAPLLPYMMAAEPPCECQYTLGHYRPGSCAPYQPHHLPWSTKGFLLEAGIITGLFFAIY